MLTPVHVLLQLPQFSHGVISIMDRTFYGQFGKVILRNKRIGYNLDVMHAKGLTQLHAGKPCIELFIFIGWGRIIFALNWFIGVQLMNFVCFRFSVVLFNIPMISKSRTTLYLSSPRLYVFIVLNLVVFVFTVLIH